MFACQPCCRSDRIEDRLEDNTGFLNDDTGEPIAGALEVAQQTSFVALLELSSAITGIAQNPVIGVIAPLPAEQDLQTEEPLSIVTQPGVKAKSKGKAKAKAKVKAAAKELQERKTVAMGAGQYKGQWLGDTIQGFGKLDNKKMGVVYQGNFHGGKAHGEGKLTQKGQIYEGQWVADAANGQAKWQNDDGETYEGQFVNSKQSGQGVYNWKDGSSYDGGFKDGMKAGKGTFYSEPGKTQYIGQFKANMMDGKGKYFFEHGRVYDGQWKVGKLEGDGVMTWENNTKYTGKFLNGKRHGFGTFLSTDGSQYKGEWIESKQHGQGQLISPDGQSQAGIWENGTFKGLENAVNATVMDEANPIVKAKWYGDGSGKS